MLMQLYFQATGIRAECTRIGADGGVDVHLFRNGEATPYAYIQCKAWVGDVGVKEVREFFGVMSADKIGEGYFVTSGSFTPDAIAFAKNRVVLIDGADLVKRINQLPPAARAKVLSEITTGDYRTPTCPSCDIKLILRDHGPAPFWGCKNFPRCTTKIYVRKART
jgi:restriction system protein